MKSNKIIVVFGATGSQGGALVRAILAHDTQKEFYIRAVTRNRDSEKVLKFTKMMLEEENRVEVIEADANDLEQVTMALKDAYGAFFVTNPFDPSSCATLDLESKQAWNFAKASEVVGLHHAIWSTTEDPLEDVPMESDAIPTLTATSQDGSQTCYKLPHFENKAKGDTFFQEFSVPTTFILPGFFYENFLSYFPIKREGENNSLQFLVPTGDAKIPMTSAEDIGKVALAIFQGGPKEFAGKKIGISTEHLSMDDVSERFSKVLGESVSNNKFVTAEIFSTFGFPMCQELANMFIYWRDFNAQYRSRRSVDETKNVYSDLTSFEDYVQENKEIFVNSFVEVVA